MVTLCALMLVHGKHVSWWAFLRFLFHKEFFNIWIDVLRTWLPSLVLLGIVVTIVVLGNPTLAPV